MFKVDIRHSADFPVGHFVRHEGHAQVGERFVNNGRVRPVVPHPHVHCPRYVFQGTACIPVFRYVQHGVIQKTAQPRSGIFLYFKPVACVYLHGVYRDLKFKHDDVGVFVKAVQRDVLLVEGLYPVYRNSVRHEFLCYLFPLLEFPYCFQDELR